MLLFALFFPCAVTAQKACFNGNDDLRQAVRDYVKDPHPESVTAKMYGWPIGVWCVKENQDFSNVFATMRTFNEDLSLWNMSQATSLYRMFDRATSFDRDLSSWGKKHCKHLYTLCTTSYYFLVHLKTSQMWRTWSACSTEQRNSIKIFLAGIHLE